MNKIDCIRIVNLVCIPDQPRKPPDAAYLLALSESLSAIGQLLPVVAVEVDGELTALDGEPRLPAAADERAEDIDSAEDHAAT